MVLWWTQFLRQPSLPSAHGPHATPPPPPAPPRSPHRRHGCLCTTQVSHHNFTECVQVAFEMDAVSAAAVTATRPTSPNAGPHIPPTDLLVLHSAAKLSLYVASRHVCDIRLRVPGLDGGLPPYSSFLRESQTVPKEAESPGEYVCASLFQYHWFICSADTVIQKASTGY